MYRYVSERPPPPYSRFVKEKLKPEGKLFFFSSNYSYGFFFILDTLHPYLIYPQYNMDAVIHLLRLNDYKFRK